jgi:hypothetical protein
VLERQNPKRQENPMSSAVFAGLTCQALLKVNGEPKAFIKLFILQ